MSPLNKFFVFFSAIMSLGGAFNSGWSSFYLAIPFMAYLVYKGYKSGTSFFVASIIFVLACIAVSKTLEKNSFVFPVLKGGEVTVLKDGFQRTFQDGSGGFVAFENLTTNKPSNEQQKVFDDFKTDPTRNKLEYYDSFTSTITKIKKDEKYAVTGLFDQTDDLSSTVSIITSVGKFRIEDIDSKSATYSIKLNKKLQTTWSKYLGNLMYWPVFPILIMTVLISKL